MLSKITELKPSLSRGQILAFQTTALGETHTMYEPTGNLPVEDNKDKKLVEYGVGVHIDLFISQA